jgi:Ca2+-binding RTX toxin-like protein
LTRALPVLVVAIVALALAPSALAANVSKSGGTVTYSSAYGGSNCVYVEQQGTSSIRIYEDCVTDPPVLETSAQTDCSLSGNDVNCSNVDRVVVNTWDRDDYVNAIYLYTIPATLNGGDDSDDLIGGQADDTINGEEGDDGLDCPYYYCGTPTGLTGGGGDDTINGGNGMDLLWGDFGTYGYCKCSTNPGNDNLNGNAGNDGIYGEQGNDRIDGGTGSDGDPFFNIKGDVAVTGCFPPNCGNYVVPGLFGGPGDDAMTGGDGRDRMYGMDGNDSLDGGAEEDYIAGDFGNNSCDACGSGEGNDALQGGEGEDDLYPGGGADTTDGGSGSDYIFEFADANSDDVHGGPDQDNYEYDNCNDANAHIDVSLDDQPNDGDNEDDPSNNVHRDVNNVDVDNNCSDTPVKLIGDDAANVLDAADGPDIVDGGAGADSLDGDDGADVMQSRDGFPDYVDCGPGIDKAVVDQFDTVESCEEVDLANVRSAFDLDNPPVPPPPVDRQGPKTDLGGPRNLTVDQFLAGFNISVTCDEDCKIQARVLASQPAGDVNLAKNNGFNLVLGRRTAGFGKGKRTMKIRPCTPIRSSSRKAECLARLRRSATRKRSFLVKVHVFATDRLGNRTEKTKLIRVRR